MPLHSKTSTKGTCRERFSTTIAPKAPAARGKARSEAARSLKRIRWWIELSVAVVILPKLSRQQFLQRSIKGPPGKRVKNFPKSLSAPAPSQTKQSKPTQRKTYALDYFCCAVDSLAAWLHRSFRWRADSPAARHRGHRPDRKPDLRTAFALASAPS